MNEKLRKITELIQMHGQNIVTTNEYAGPAGDGIVIRFENESSIAITTSPVGNLSITINEIVTTNFNV